MHCTATLYSGAPRWFGFSLLHPKLSNEERQRGREAQLRRMCLNAPECCTCILCLREKAMLYSLPQSNHDLLGIAPLDLKIRRQSAANTMTCYGHIVFLDPTRTIRRGTRLGNASCNRRVQGTDFCPVESAKTVVYAFAICIVDHINVIADTI